MSIKLKLNHIKPFVKQEQIDDLLPKLMEAKKALDGKSGKGKEFLGWLNPTELNSQQQIEKIKNCGAKIAKQSQAVIVVGIGGSYLGSRAAIEYIVSPLHNVVSDIGPQILFLGNAISPSHILEVLQICKGKELSVIVISKSGTTTEPAIAFRILKEEMENRYGDQAKNRIFAVTDENKGALLSLSKKEGYETFIIPDDVGGRYSVLTPVGLLPMAVAGIDIEKVLEGAKEAFLDCQSNIVEQNSCLQYVLYRNLMLQMGRSVELFCGWDSAFVSFCEWLKQLFGESEGKDQKGVFPASAIYSTDLHSIGQFVQQGSDILFETMLSFTEDNQDLFMKEQENDLDQLNYLAGKSLSQIIEATKQAVADAHFSGNTPSMAIDIKDRTPSSCGYMFYFFEYACGVSGYLLGVNPFDQPGVEEYKKNMFALLGKKGYN